MPWVARNRLEDLCVPLSIWLLCLLMLEKKDELASHVCQRQFTLWKLLFFSYVVPIRLPCSLYVCCEAAYSSFLVISVMKPR